MCVNLPVPAHQVLPFTVYIFEASYSMSATRINKIWGMDQPELLNLSAGIATLANEKVSMFQNSKIQYLCIISHIEHVKPF